MADVKIRFRVIVEDDVECDAVASGFEAFVPGRPEWKAEAHFAKRMGPGDLTGLSESEVADTVRRAKLALASVMTDWMAAQNEVMAAARELLRPDPPDSEPPTAAEWETDAPPQPQSRFRKRGP